MSNTAIEVVNLSKLYHIGGVQKSYDRFGEQLVDLVVAPFRRASKMLQGKTSSASELEEELWALDKISLEINHGEAVGVIGRNGAGKSTLLKILSRITEPTSGYADIFGRVGSLLEVGTGFHPELTGRENIYLNGAILGMRKAEIDRKLDEIIDFAEIEKFIDTPVKHFSSGMYVRLAFSVAAHLEPEILLVDEVLAVGDLAFQRKCLGKMDDVAHEGRTVLFVSHNMGLMQTFLHARHLFGGRNVAFDGSISDTIDTYLKSIEQNETQNLAERRDRKGLGNVRLIDVKINSCREGASTILKTGEPVRFTFQVNQHVPGMNMNFSIYDQIGQAVMQFRTKDRSPKDIYEPGNPLTFVCEVEQLYILPGRYRVDVGIIGDNRLQDYIEAAAFFDVSEGFIDGRLERHKEKFSVGIPHIWTLPVNG